jgi:hypothetical protein
MADHLRPLLVLPRGQCLLLFHFAEARQLHGSNAFDSSLSPAHQCECSDLQP